MLANITSSGNYYDAFNALRDPFQVVAIAQPHLTQNFFLQTHKVYTVVGLSADHRSYNLAEDPWNYYHMDNFLTLEAYREVQLSQLDI